MSEEAVFPSKWLNKIPESLKDGVGSMSDEEIKERIVQIEQGISQFEKDMENDEKLSAAKQILKELKENYTVPIKEHQLMIKFLVFNLDQRGK
jgi:hypothetical protein